MFQKQANIVKITVPSKWTDKEAFGQLRNEIAVFQLGLGPCGKSVERLDFDYSGSFFVVLQFHTDGTRKDFFYTDLTGRVEVEYN